MSADDSNGRVLSRKEAAKEQRHAAYQRAKARWANDPRRLAMKEAAKEQRRAAYRKAKERRKAAAVAEKTKLRAARCTKESDKLAEARQELSRLMAWMSEGSRASN